MLRNEYKLWMYSKYLVPSKLFLLTIHTLTDTHLKLLDTLTDKSVKKWSGLPPSATNAISHMKEGLNFKSISELYMESHTVSHTRTRQQGDAIVNSVIDSSVQRDSGFTRKKSTCNEAKQTYQACLQSNIVSVGTEIIPGDRAAQLRNQCNTRVSDSVKDAMAGEKRKKWESHVKELAVQGNILALV